MRYDLTNKYFSWILAVCESFSRKNEPYFEFAKDFSAKSVAKIVKRECFCQKIRVFLARESFCSRKFLPLKYVDIY